MRNDKYDIYAVAGKYTQKSGSTIRLHTVLGGRLEGWRLLQSGLTGRLIDVWSLADCLMAIDHSNEGDCCPHRAGDNHQITSPETGHVLLWSVPDQATPKIAGQNTKRLYA